MATSNTITQIDFSGGMSALWDPTKTAPNQYRIGINCRARKNGIEGSFKPTKIPTPNLIHQAIFSADDKLVLIAGGQAYVLTNGVMNRVESFSALSTTADVVYHEAVPAPTNFFVNDTYASSVSTTPECIVLQDGENVPRLLLSNLASQLAGVYANWSYGNPAYVPIGKQMAFSGNKLFVVSTDGKKIYQSVSGRPLDFVLNIRNGKKGGDADTTYLAVSAAKLKAIVGTQEGGVLGFTGYRAYTLTPQDAVRTIFGEPYMRPAELFPVGAVNNTSFTRSNGETLFISSRGINKFNETQQVKWQSNISPFGAPIVDFIVRPITRVACASLDDYTFFALSTVFGDGVLVYDNQLQAFVGIDLVGAVKEFAYVEDNGTPRLYYITYTNELYEYNLFSGETSDYAVYFGEYNSGDALTRMRPTSVECVFGNVENAGVATVEMFIDKRASKIVTKDVAVENSDKSQRGFKTVPYSLPLEGNTDVVSNTFDFCGEPYGYALGVFIHCTARARLVSMSLRGDTVENTAVEGRITEESDEVFIAFGSARADLFTSGESYAATEVGKRYYYYADGAGTLMNGEKEFSPELPLNTLVFNAASNVTYFANSGNLIDYSTVETILNLEPNARVIFLGDAGYKDSFGHFRAMGDKNGNLLYALAGDADRKDDATTADFCTKLGFPAYHCLETTHVRFFFCSFDLNETQSVIDADGELVSTPPEMLETGLYAQRIAQTIANGESKVNIVCFHFPAYSSILSPGYAALRWNFKRMGVHGVLSAAALGYERNYLNGVHYVNAGTGDKANIQKGTGDIATAGALILSARRGFVSGEFRGIDGIARDRFSITR